LVSRALTPMAFGLSFCPNPHFFQAGILGGEVFRAQGASRFTIAVFFKRLTGHGMVVRLMYLIFCGFAASLFSLALRMRVASELRRHEKQHQKEST